MGSDLKQCLPRLRQSGLGERLRKNNGSNEGSGYAIETKEEDIISRPKSTVKCCI